jgi:hypothetical protein
MVRGRVTSACGFVLNNYKALFSSEQMGGDHRCPVCQATFTRPQHVARHMRSRECSAPPVTPLTPVDTGDRPYKCLYCGDQFARRYAMPCLRLPSRSSSIPAICFPAIVTSATQTKSPFPPPAPVAGAPPPLRVQPPRNRPAISVSSPVFRVMVPILAVRPVTPFVLSDLLIPALPDLAKCVQRKCRCTYVKFHRQTAPVGPGHNTRPAAMGSAGAAAPVAGGMSPHLDSRMPIYQHADDLLLGTHTVVPSMADNIYSQPYNFPPIYEHSGDPTLVDNSDLAIAAKYRTQPDPYRRMAVSSSTAPGAGLIPGLYSDPRQQPTSNWMAWENDPSFTSTTTNHHEGIHGNGFR